MKKALYILWKKTEGETILEFSIILPVFLLLTFGVIDFGFIFYQRASLSYALLESSRYVLINPTATENEIFTFAQSRIVILAGSIQFSSTLTPDFSTPLSGNFRHTFFSRIIPSMESPQTVTIPLGIVKEPTKFLSGLFIFSLVMFSRVSLLSI
ncbi:MAG: pilus assembly protein [Alphaproteobacteria bacterium]|nr:pilus assembly protein [Alphaproteobacteria bacterium]